jgi:MFS family permease
MHGVGEGWLMTSLTASPRTVALLQAVDGAALFLLALPAGALADIVDRRRLAIGAQIWLFACAGSMGVLAAVVLAAPILIGLPSRWGSAPPSTSRSGRHSQRRWSRAASCREPSRSAACR